MPASRVPGLVGDLLAWLAATNLHPLIVSCALLAWLPIEEVIRSRQQGYYEALGQAEFGDQFGEKFGDQGGATVGDR